MRRITGTVILVGMLASAQVVAQQEWACSDEAQKLCADVEPGGGRVARCLVEQPEQLSEACRAALQSISQRMTRFGEACGPDIQEYCADVEPGGGRVGKCLIEHRADISSACAGALKGG